LGELSEVETVDRAYLTGMAQAASTFGNLLTDLVTETGGSTRIFRSGAAYCFVERTTDEL
jgi:hypothetical protein